MSCCGARPLSCQCLGCSCYKGRHDAEEGLQSRQAAEQGMQGRWRAKELRPAGGRVLASLLPAKPPLSSKGALEEAPEGGASKEGEAPPLYSTSLR